MSESWILHLPGGGAVVLSPPVFKHLPELAEVRSWADDGGDDG